MYKNLAQYDDDNLYVQYLQIFGTIVKIDDDSLSENIFYIMCVGLYDGTPSTTLYSVEFSGSKRKRDRGNKMKHLE